MGELAHPVSMSKPDLANAPGAIWPGLDIRLLHHRAEPTFETVHQRDRHFVVLCERLVRIEGESKMHGLPATKMRNASKRISIVPAGCSAMSWGVPKDDENFSIRIYIDRTFPSPIREYFDPQTLEPCQFGYSPMLRSTILKMADAVRNPLLASDLYKESLTHIFLNELNYFQRPPHDGKNCALDLMEERISTVQHYIVSHLDESLSLVDLSQRVDLSPSQLIRAFSQRVGSPPHRYIVDQRIREAKRILRDSSMPLAQVASECGFADQAHMTALFSKRCGITPRAYRLRKSSES